LENHAGRDVHLLDHLDERGGVGFDDAVIEPFNEAGEFGLADGLSIARFPGLPVLGLLHVEGGLVGVPRWRGAGKGIALVIVQECNDVALVLESANKSGFTFEPVDVDGERLGVDEHGRFADPERVGSKLLEALDRFAVGKDGKVGVILLVKGGRLGLRDKKGDVLDRFMIEFSVIGHKSSKGWSGNGAFEVVRATISRRR